MKVIGACLALMASLASAQAPSGFPTGQVVERVSSQRDPTQTYALYLPGAYSPERRWPALLVMDPRGRAVVALELFREAAERYGWIVLSSYDTRSDGPADPNVRALDAMWPEVHLRFAVDPKRIYAAGFSGGAHLAWALGKPPGALAGVIASGGRFIPELLPQRATYASFAAAGDTDFNYQGTRKLDAALGEAGAHHRLEIFQGPHQWMPPELAALAVQWMEVQAMREGLRERDAQLVDAACRADLDAARALEASGQLLAAQRRFGAVVHSYAGLADVSQAEEASARVAASSACKAELKEEERWDVFEGRYEGRLAQALGDLRSLDPPMPGKRLLAALDVAGLQRQAGLPGVAGTTARRILNRDFVQVAFYGPQELLAQHAIPQAIASLEVAVAIRPENETVWYNLACARSRGGQVKAALEALGRAVDLGFKDAALLASDPDLDAVRRREGFPLLLARLRPSP